MGAQGIRGCEVKPLEAKILEALAPGYRMTVTELRKATKAGESRCLLPSINRLRRAGKVQTNEPWSSPFQVWIVEVKP